MCGRSIPEADPERRRVMEEGKKNCTRCGNEFLLTDFSKNITSKDGLEYWCKKCKSSRQRQYREKKIKSCAAPKRAYRRRTTFRDVVVSRRQKEPLTTASPEAIIAALRKGVAKEIIQLIEERFQ
jgi:hypothetical protein